MQDPSASVDPLPRAQWVAGAFIAVAALAAYYPSFGVPFLLDDASSISGNPTIRHLWPLTDALSPPHGGGLTVEGRPVLNLSLALNVAISGSAVWSYHAVNLAIHVAAGLTLFGIVRRTFSAASRDAFLFALTTALLWTLHPLQTESVTYIIQRAESLMGLFFLLTLYGFIRGISSPRPVWALGFSVGTCLLGMATKEVMVAAPLVVLLYDATFVTGGFGAALRARRGYYAALAATWVLLARLVVAAGDRGGTIGALTGVAWWEFALTQSRAVIHYAKLAVLPSPLIFDYGSDFVLHALSVAPHVALHGL